MLAFVDVGRAALSPTQYRARAGAICQKSTNAASNALSLFPGWHAPPSAIVTYLKADLRVHADEYKALRALDPPSVFRALHAKMLALEKQALAQDTAVIAKINAGADPLKTLKADDKKIRPLDAAMSAAWQKVDVPDCYD